MGTIDIYLANGTWTVASRAGVFYGLHTPTEALMIAVDLAEITGETIRLPE